MATDSQSLEDRTNQERTNGGYLLRDGRYDFDIDNAVMSATFFDVTNTKKKRMPVHIGEPKRISRFYEQGTSTQISRNSKEFF